MGRNMLLGILTPPTKTSLSGFGPVFFDPVIFLSDLGFEVDGLDWAGDSSRVVGTLAGGKNL